MDKIVRSEHEINEVMNWVADSLENGSHFPGQTYEEGVQAMYDWLTGAIDDRPDGD
jgi:hypothetical protein